MDRYVMQENTSHDPLCQFMVWDFEENRSICFCDNKLHAQEIAKAMNILNFAKSSVLEIGD